MAKESVNIWRKRNRSKCPLTGTLHISQCLKHILFYCLVIDCKARQNYPFYHKRQVSKLPPDTPSQASQQILEMPDHQYYLKYLNAQQQRLHYW
mmetsp:Transcript_1198/g.2422  ORF Transcript_1198/g.2422 Transcript_1198/m.2422 type:complete len:94 (-) Transcript_1198:2332-2613(-)